MIFQTMPEAQLRISERVKELETQLIYILGSDRANLRIAAAVHKARISTYSFIEILEHEVDRAMGRGRL
jgi:hypothetical protein